MMELSRRGFLARSGSAGLGLTIGVYLLPPNRALGALPPLQPAPDVHPNTFVRINLDNTVTVLSKHIEFGQGPYTGLSTLVAEELDADWSQMRAEASPVGTAYVNLRNGLQLTGGSSAIRNSFMQMRQVGATMRAMLVSAAAARWGVRASGIEVSKGVLSHPSGKRGTFGEFAEAAMQEPVPEQVSLKDPKDFVLIGTTVPKLDTRPKTEGTAQYTIDLDRPNQVLAMVERPPRFGSKAVSVDDTDARTVPGYLASAIVPGGVAVYADGFWAAKQARHRLKVEWDESSADRRSTAELEAQFRAKLDTPGVEAARRGDPDARLAAPGEGARVVRAEFVFPYLAHAPMEPLDALMERTSAGGVEAWYGCQAGSWDREALAKVLGVPQDKVTIHTQLAGGSFGRRAQLGGAFAVEAAHALLAAPEGRPVKVVQTREDDIRGGYYRPLTVHRMEAVLADGGIAAWRHRIVGQPLRPPPEGASEHPIDPALVEGAQNLPYAIPELAVEARSELAGVPVLWWRSVGSTQNGYATEVFYDQLLQALGRDAVEGRLALLEDPRFRGVLQVAAEAADWGRMPPAGRALGVAVHQSFHTYVAQVAEVGRTADGLPQVHKVWCAVDCGIAVNPNIIAAQMEGGIGYGLGAMLFNEVLIEDGRVVPGNFDSYRSLRMGEMPEVEVLIIPSAEPPTGVGEPAVPVIAPAVANAWARLTGERIYELPFTRHRRNR